MKNTIKNGTPVQGAESAHKNIEDMDVKTVEEWLTRDLQAMRSLIIAISSDPDLVRQVAVFMHGRLINEKNRRNLQKEVADV